MEKEEQLVGLSNNDATQIIAKGKRTKRLRLLFPCGGGGATPTSTCSSVNSGDSSSTTTFESAELQEDEDMAKCLILLAQGGGSEDSHHQKKHDGDDGNNKTEKGRKFAEMATATTNTKIGNFFIYECKTCNRTFPSFQALGGHRASHKKPKLMAEEKKPSPISQPQPQSQSRVIANYDQFEETEKPHIKTGPPISIHRTFHANKTKIHECSICGSEFTSGQALGGHMRRHRATNATTTKVLAIERTDCNTTAAAVPAVKVEVQSRNILELDLNLPAPEEDLRENKFQFTAAPALVDCHY